MRQQRLREYWFPLALAVFFVLAGSLPYLYAYRSVQPGQQFMGFVGRGTPGANSYFMMARQSQEGYNCIENFYAPEPRSRSYFHFEWWAFGKFARRTGLSLIATFHIWRVVGVFAYLFAIYYLAAAALDTVFKRRTAVALICFGTGFGWLLWILNQYGLDLPISRDLKGIGVPGYLMNKPHFIRAGIFAALQYGFLLSGERTGKRHFFVLSGLAASFGSMIRPFHILETYGVCFLFPVLRSIQDRRINVESFKNYLLAAAVHTPMLLWHAYVWKENPLGLSPWQHQAEFMLHQMLWLGLPFTLICIQFLLKGFSHIPRAKAPSLMLGLWLFLALLGVNAFPYLSWAQESHYAFVMVPPILAVAGALPWLYRSVLTWKPLRQRFPLALDSLRLRRLAAVALIVASTPTTMFVYAQFFTQLHAPSGQWRYYISDDLAAAFEWIEKHSEPDTVVLASNGTSQFIPRFMDRKVVTSHDILTPYFGEKSALVHRFFAQEGDEEFKRYLIGRFDIRYVVYGEFEQEIGDQELGDCAWLDPVFTGGRVTVFKVMR